VRQLTDLTRDQRVPVRLWADDADDATIKQLARVAAQPYVVEAVCGMADAHLSMGVAVGTVFATRREVVPGALGGDLGCGMSASRLAAESSAPTRSDLERILLGWSARIPVGDAVFRRAPDTVAPPDGVHLSTRALAHRMPSIVARHLGTLGGGNHFVELDRDANGGLWLLVHTGSRGLGASIAKHHGAAAGTALDPLRPLVTDDDAGRAALADLEAATRFAAANRAVIAAAASTVVAEVLGCGVAVAETIDVPHNHVAAEQHRGEGLLVHRKGAVAVPAGARALVPGSMGTASYVVEGLGAVTSFASCSHGAGRLLSRTRARADIPRAAFERSMSRVVHPRDAPRLIEEAPAAYREIRGVLEAQRDLCAPRVRLEPLVVLKG
jgi:tRNA-splicing ligase RtcB